MCPAHSLLRATLLLCLLVGSRQLSITEFYVPGAAQSGEVVELHCRYENGGAAEEGVIVKWWWTPVGAATDTTQLYQRIAGQPGQPIGHAVEVRENDTLVLVTSPAVSGLYECEVSLMSEKITEVRRHQHLTVYTQGSGPNITISEVPDGPDADEEEDLLIECRAEDVAPAPDIDLTVDGVKYSMAESSTGPDEEGLFDIVGNVTLSKDAVLDKEVRCELFFLDKSVSHPQYVDVETYDSGAPSTSESPEDSTEAAATANSTSDSLQNQSGESNISEASFSVLLLLALVTQLPAFL